MSCTISLLPMAIMGLVSLATTLATAGTVTAAGMTGLNAGASLVDKLNGRNYLKDALNNVNSEDVTEVVNIISKEYDTVFADIKLLKKTLEEHGAKEVQYTYNGLSCKIDCFAIDFYRENENEAFKMKVVQDCKENSENTFEELNLEYGMNTQEESYMKIKERLEAQNLKIAEEEILEDNSIVLTVNLD